MAQDVGRDENLSPGSVPLTLKQYFHSLTNSGQRSVINLISRPSESIFSAPLLPSCPFLGRQPVILPSCSEESFSGRFINHLFYESQQHSAVIFAVYSRLVCKTKRNAWQLEEMLCRGWRRCYCCLNKDSFGSFFLKLTLTLHLAHIFCVFYLSWEEKRRIRLRSAPAFLAG